MAASVKVLLKEDCLGERVVCEASVMSGQVGELSSEQQDALEKVTPHS